MEKKEMLEGLVMRRTVLDEEASNIGDGDSIGYNHIESSSVTFTVIFSTLVAMSGSYAFGNAVGYSSPAKSGIMEDLGLSLAEVFFLSFDLGMGGIPWIIVSEIFPVNIRSSAGSLVNLINWTSSWVVAYTFTFLFEWSPAGTFFISTFIGGVGIVFTAKLVPETKGRTLEEIQASMTQNLQENNYQNLLSLE